MRPGAERLSQAAKWEWRPSRHKYKGLLDSFISHLILFICQNLKNKILCVYRICYIHVNMTDLAFYYFFCKSLINYAVRIKPNKGRRFKRSTPFNPTRQPCFDLDPNIDGYSVWRSRVMPYLCCCIDTGSQL